MMWNQKDLETWQATWATLAFRLPLMWMQAVQPTPEGKTEMTRMVTEKHKAMVDGMWAAQRQWLSAWVSLWTRPFASPSPQTTALRVTEAALAPARRTVKANARRLKKY